jgi:hypothetical protein
MRIKCETCNKEYPTWKDFHKEHFLDESWEGDYNWHLINGPFYPVHKVENEQEWVRQWVENMAGKEEANKIFGPKQ